ncbi:MAG: hypothetical protein ABJG47_04720 [Ekhidna sp.]
MFIIISASLFASCNVGELEFDDLEVTPISGVFSFPLGQTTYLMRDLVSNQTGDSLSFQEDSTSLYTLLYYDTITYSAPDDIVQINDINFNGSLTSIPIAVGPASVNLIESFQTEYNPQSSEQLDSVFYESGDLTITTTSTINGDLSYTFTIANTTNVNTGTAMTIAGNISGGGSDMQTRSLINHKTVLSDPSGSNVFDIDLNAVVTLNGAQSLAGTETLSFDLTYGNQTFSLIYGKFGRDTIQVGNQSIEIDFFTQTAREGITFGNPSISFDFRNTFGIPIGVDFASVYGEDGNGDQTFLTGSVITSDPVITGSGLDTPTPATPGETAQTIVEINRGNSNLVNLLSKSPQRLVFDVAGISNPESLTEGNYLQPTSSISAYVAVEVPMEIQLENFSESGTFGLGDGLDLSNVDSAFIRLVTNNELPFNGTVNLEVKDADSVTLFPITDTTDPLFSQEQFDRFTNIPVIKAPLININGEVTDPSGATQDIALTPQEVELLSGASHVVITMVLNTPVSQTSRDIYVKILANYTLNLKVGIGGKFNLEL